MTGANTVIRLLNRHKKTTKAFTQWSLWTQATRKQKRGPVKGEHKAKEFQLCFSILNDKVEKLVE
jgi:hypothetical protein